MPSEQEMGGGLDDEQEVVQLVEGVLLHEQVRGRLALDAARTLQLLSAALDGLHKAWNHGCRDRKALSPASSRFT